MDSDTTDRSSTSYKDEFKLIHETGDSSKKLNSIEKLIIDDIKNEREIYQALKEKLAKDIGRNGVINKRIDLASKN